MRYLLDTNCFLFTIHEPEKIPTKIQSLLVNPENEIYVSVASLWEISIKVKKKKLELYKPLQKIIAQDIHNNDINVLNITANDIQTFYSLRNKHNDPFDLIIISQAIQNKLSLITSDKIIKQYKQIKTLW